MNVVQTAVLQGVDRHRSTGTAVTATPAGFTAQLVLQLLCLPHDYRFGVCRVGQLAVVAGVWAFQLLVSPLWLGKFRFGPAEWLWRTLTYVKLQPMVRRAEPC